MAAEQTTAGESVIIGSIKELHSSQDFSDVTITCKGYETTWKAHKLVVCAHSEALKAALFRGAELEGKPEKNDLNLEGDEPVVIDAMLNYMYKLDYDDVSTSSEQVAAMVLDVKVFVIADKYLIKPLTDLAHKNFQRRCARAPHTTAFADAVQEVYLTAPGHDDRLKRTVLETVEMWSHRIFAIDGEQGAHVTDTMRELPNFSIDVAVELAGAKAKLLERQIQAYRCPSQGEVFHVGIPPPLRFTCSEGHTSVELDSWWVQFKV